MTVMNLLVICVPQCQVFYGYRLPLKFHACTDSACFAQLHILHFQQQFSELHAGLSCILCTTTIISWLSTTVFRALCCILKHNHYIMLRVLGHPSPLPINKEGVEKQLPGTFVQDVLQTAYVNCIGHAINYCGRHLMGVAANHARYYYIKDMLRTLTPYKSNRQKNSSHPLLLLEVRGELMLLQAVKCEGDTAKLLQQGLWENWTTVGRTL